VPYGEGKYDALCTKAREEAEAKGTLLIVIEGNKGSGFSAQLPTENLLSIPTMLRTVADQIEEANKELPVN
jgi:hypothetical protein